MGSGAKIDNHVQETCKGSFDCSFLNSLEDWLDRVVVGWMRAANITNLSRKKLLDNLYQTYTKERIEQMFNIIIEWPDSQAALEDVRKYLKTREDTVRCIVQTLISENTTELTEELQKTQGLHLDHSFQSPDEYECLDDWESWQPDPVDAPSKSNSRRTSDIISMLVNIYGSKELFVEEYRSLLSNRLLAHCSYETEK